MPQDICFVAPDGTTYWLKPNADGEICIYDEDGTTVKMNLHTLNDKLALVSIPSGSGASPVSVSVQITDILGDALAEEVVLQLGVYQDQWGAATATTATIAVGGTGTLIKAVTADKELIVRTAATGIVVLTITNATAEAVYILAKPAPRSKVLDCSDTGTVTTT